MAGPTYRGGVTLERLALSRSAVDRAAHRRTDPKLLETALADPATRVTRSLAGYGVRIGPVYVGVSHASALTRDGFDLGRHAWSQLALGGPGWIQVTNLIVSGLMFVAFAVGLRRALVTGVGATWAPLLIGVFGLSMVVSGIFPADPVLGFPVGVSAAVFTGTSCWRKLRSAATPVFTSMSMSSGRERVCPSWFVSFRSYAARA